MTRCVQLCALDKSGVWRVKSKLSRKQPKVERSAAEAAASKVKKEKQSAAEAKKERRRELQRGYEKTRQEKLKKSGVKISRPREGLNGQSLKEEHRKQVVIKQEPEESTANFSGALPLQICMKLIQIGCGVDQQELENLRKDHKELEILRSELQEVRGELEIMRGRCQWYEDVRDWVANYTRYAVGINTEGLPDWLRIGSKSLSLIMKEKKQRASGSDTDET
ncbi:unnamed protein product [Symbiodinium sp. CCMP2592]|nr:unnamed protein product [Symbiodinium sp. CCMP2592]CAE7707323.1 unnamed protein product [Symbiodinium sp. CCMP2592]